jgi:hypothetical protein
MWARGLDSYGWRKGQLVDCFEHSHEDSLPANGGEILDHLNNYHILKKGTAARIWLVICDYPMFYFNK